MLPAKDYAYLSYFEEDCSNADYIFKGDDDILVVPYNLANLVNVSNFRNSDLIKSLRKCQELEE